MSDTPESIKARLEYLRGEIKAERISYDDIAELQGLAEYIAPDDVELLEWAGVPEFSSLPNTKPATFTPLPEKELRSLIEFEAERLGFTIEETAEQFSGAWLGYVENYSTDSPGFVGEIAVALWPAASNAVTIWKRLKGAAWMLSHQSDW